MLILIVILKKQRGCRPREFDHAMALVTTESSTGTDMEGHAANLICGSLVSERIWHQRDLLALGGAGLLLAAAWLAKPARTTG